MAIEVGSTVITPDGRKATVREVWHYLSGRPGRPKKTVEVQLRNERGNRYTKERREYEPRDLKVA